MEPAKKLLLADLPADVVQHILVRLTLAHHIARTAPTCKVASVAVRNAIKVRQFSSEVQVLQHPEVLTHLGRRLDLSAGRARLGGGRRVLLDEAVALRRIDRRHNERPPELLAVLLASTSGSRSGAGWAVEVRLMCGA